MKYSALITELREDYLDDAVAPYQWSDAKLLRYLNDAVDEAVIRAHLKKSTQSITVVADTATYSLNDDCLEVDVMKTTLNGGALTQATEEEISTRCGRDWREHTGTPRLFIRSQQTITLYPIPDANDTATVKYFQRHEAATGTSEEPDIEEKHHRYLNFWAAHRALMTRDVDQNDTERSERFLQRFEQYFGPRRSAQISALNSPKYATVQGMRMA